MTRLAFFLLLGLCFASTAPAAVVFLDSKVEFEPGPPGPIPGSPPVDYGLLVDQDVFGDYTGTWFELGSLQADYSLVVKTFHLDDGADWYSVEAGDVFTAATIDASKFTTLLKWGQKSPPVAVGEDFYLGVNTGNTVPDLRNAFGWIHFKVVDDVLTMVGNAMSYESPGIVVGSTTLVPEPNVIGMAVAAVILLVRLRQAHEL
jgi:hypothetical protein